MVKRLKQLFQLDLFRDLFHESKIQVEKIKSDGFVSKPNKVAGSSALINAPSPPVHGFDNAISDSNQTIKIEWSRRTLRSWSMQWRKGQSIRLRLPLIMQSAPSQICEAVVNWAIAVSKGNRGHNKTKRREFEVQIQAWLDGAEAINKEQIVRRKKSAIRLLSRLVPKGKHHDLEVIFDSINDTYFEGKLKAKLTWSARVGGLSTHSLRPDPQGGSLHLISISRGYDMPSVTPEILGGVVYHECLHIVYPPYIKGNRRIVHDARFRQAEKQYVHYQTWINWHCHELPKALRKLELRAKFSL